MRVCLITQKFPPYFYGGTASSCLDLANNLVKEGIEVEVFCGRGRLKKEQSIVRARNLDERIKVTTITNYPAVPRLSFILNNIMTGCTLLDKVVDSADIVHAFSSIGFLVSYIKNKTRKPVVSNIHALPSNLLHSLSNLSLSAWKNIDVLSDFLGYPISNLLMKNMLCNSDQIIVTSLHTRNETIKCYHLPVNKVNVIQNSIDFNAPYITSLNKTTENYDSNSIIFCGRLTWVKGLHYLIKSFNILVQKLKNVNLKIVGWGALGPYFKKIVSELDLNHNIHFLGSVSRDKVLREIESSAFLVVPSLYETGPIVALEAMALKKPIVAYNLPFARKFIFHGYNGLLAKQFDFEDFAENMFLLLTDKVRLKKLGENAFYYVKKNHNWSINIKKYIKVYEKILNN